MLVAGNESMKGYQAKEAYLDKVIAEKYEQRRFSTPLGKFIDRREKELVLGMLKKLPLARGRILDLPCGTGRVSQLLAERSFRVVGADISPNMIRTRQEKIEDRVDLVVCDAEKLPFKDGAFDCVVSLRLMGHIPPEIRAKILEEMRRVTGDGIIVFYYNPHSLMGIFREVRNRLRGKREQWNPITPSGLKRELEAVGLNLVKVKPLLWKLSETYVLLAGKL
jgi:ubiquinone/menaquinone biosynthesis C-methylase UbiE